MKVTKIGIYLTLVFLFFVHLGNAQTTIKVLNSTFIKLSNGSKIIVSDPSTNPIQKTGTSGGIWTPSENEKIIVNVSDLTGQFIIPFVSSVGNTIPFEYTITNAGNSTGRILFSTYETGNNNLPYPSGVTDLVHNGNDDSPLVIDRFWLIDVDGYTTKPKGTYTFTYDDNDLVGNSIYEPNLFMQRWNDMTNMWGDWLSSPTTNSSTNKIMVNISSSAEQYKIWTVVDQGQTLPIELLSFVSNCETNNVEWITATEINNDLFILQGTNDGVNFTNLDTIKGAGNSNQTLFYSLSLNDWNFPYYRLQQKDFDGRIENSFIINGCTKNNNVEPILYPNPNNGQFLIIHNSEYSFDVFDMMGRVVWSEKSNRMSFDLTTISNGEYFIRLTKQNENSKTLKFVKIN